MRRGGTTSMNNSESNLPAGGGALKSKPKYVRVLTRLLQGPLDRLEAEQLPVADHVLNSTVAELKRRGLVIHAQLVRKHGYGGLGVHVASYTLAPESRARALQLIGAA
jgi:hypothetical protein